MKILLSTSRNEDALAAWAEKRKFKLEAVPVKKGHAPQFQISLGKRAKGKRGSNMLVLFYTPLKGEVEVWFADKFGRLQNSWEGDDSFIKVDGIEQLDKFATWAINADWITNYPDPKFDPKA